MDSAKQNIKKIVKAYIKLCPDEYAAFQEQMKVVRATLSDKETGLVEGFRSVEANNVSRALYEMPLTLHEMLVTNLSEEQMNWLKRGGEHGLEGGYWFAKTFPAFRIPERL